MVVRDAETVAAFVNSMEEKIRYFSQGRIPVQKIRDMAEAEVSKLDFNNEWQIHKGIGYFAMQAVNRYFAPQLRERIGRIK